MRYPQNADVGLIIRHALYMKSPDIYQCPPNAFVYVINSMKQQHKMRHSLSTPSRQAAKPRPIPERRPAFSYTKIFPVSAVGAMAIANVADLRVSEEIRKNAMEDLQRETQEITVHQIGKVGSQDNEGIVDGYFVDSPEVLKGELQESYNIMAVSRLKLLQYLTTLRKHIPGNRIDEYSQALDGIEELCSLLNPQRKNFFNAVAPVDAAVEADDEDFIEVEAAMALPSRSIPVRVKSSNNQTEAYEVPNNRVGKNARRMLSNRREVEMNVIPPSTIGSLDKTRYPQNDPVGERRNSE